MDAPEDHLHSELAGHSRELAHTIAHPLPPLGPSPPTSPPPSLPPTSHAQTALTLTYTVLIASHVSCLVVYLLFAFTVPRRRDVSFRERL